MEVEMQPGAEARGGESRLEAGRGCFFFVTLSLSFVWGKESGQPLDCRECKWGWGFAVTARRFR